MLPSTGMRSSAADSGNGVRPPKPSNAVDMQYMQQESQIFVFNTKLVNMAAEAVMLGRYPSIIAYHCSQPKTKKFLQKHAPKLEQFYHPYTPAQNSNSSTRARSRSARSSNGKCRIDRNSYKSSPYPGSSYKSSPYPAADPNRMYVGSRPSSPSMNIDHSRMPNWNQDNICISRNMGYVYNTENGNNGLNNIGYLYGTDKNNSSNVVRSYNSTLCDNLLSTSSLSVSSLQDTNAQISSPTMGNDERINSDDFDMQFLASTSPDSCLDLYDDLLLKSPKMSSGSKECIKDLTRQQLQHREEQLNVLQKMRDNLLAESTVEMSQQHQSSIAANSAIHELVSSLSNMDSSSDTLQSPDYLTNKSLSQGDINFTCESLSLANSTSNISLPSPDSCTDFFSPFSATIVGSSSVAEISSVLDSPKQSTNKLRNESNCSTPTADCPSPNVNQEDQSNAATSVPVEISPIDLTEEPADNVVCSSPLQSTVIQQDEQKQLFTPQSVDSTNNERNSISTVAPENLPSTMTFENQELATREVSNVDFDDISDILLPLISVMNPISDCDSKTTITTTSAASTFSSLDSVSSVKYKADILDSYTESIMDVSTQSCAELLKACSESEFPFTCNSPELLHGIPSSTMSSSEYESAIIDIDESLLAPISESGNKVCDNNFSNISHENIPLNPTSNPYHFDPISSLAQMNQLLNNNIPNLQVEEPSNCMMQSSDGFTMSYNMPVELMHNGGQVNNMSSMCIGNTGGDRKISGSIHELNNCTSRDYPLTDSSMSAGIRNTMMKNSFPCATGEVNSQRFFQNGPGPHLQSNAYNGRNIPVGMNGPTHYLPNRNGSQLMPPSNHDVNYYPWPVGPIEYPNQMTNVNVGSMIRHGIHSGNYGNAIRMRSANVGYVGGPMYFPENYPNMQNRNCRMYMEDSLPLYTGNGFNRNTGRPLPTPINQSCNSRFIGPCTNDPNYAQQFHNFQQQLYATSTRHQISGPSTTNNQPFYYRNNFP